jgi:hypothetical protein
MSKKIYIRKWVALIQALRTIEESIKEWPTPVMIDMTEVGFPLTRDVFLVMKKRFRIDHFSLLVVHEYEVEMARSIGIGAGRSWVRAEFDREYSKKNILSHNLSMWEYFLYEIRRGWEYLKFVVKRKPKQPHIHTIKKRSSNTFLIVAWLIMSLSLLLFIFHFAVSKTYVYVVPETTVRPVSANIVFSQNPEWTGTFIQEKNVVRMKKVALPVEHTMTFSIETIDPNSATTALWRLTAYNETTQAQQLKPGTRFVTEDGIVYRADSWVNIPSARTINGVTEIWATLISVRAESIDVTWKTVWSRGNIPTGTYLSIPGLRFNRDKIYAKAKENFTGGAEWVVRIVTAEDIKKWESIMREQLSRLARSQLQAWLESENKSNNESYSLLMGDSLSLTGEVMTVSSWQKVGDPAEEIEIKGITMAYALIYNRGTVIDYLATVFRERLLLGTDKELAIYTDSLRLTNIIERDPSDFMIKATMEMNTAITYDLENPSNELTRRMKVMIAGLSRLEAITRLKEWWRIKDVSISFSPFWLSRVSSNLDNIEFVIRK